MASGIQYQDEGGPQPPGSRTPEGFRIEPGHTGTSTGAKQSWDGIAPGYRDEPGLSGNPIESHNSSGVVSVGSVGGSEHNSPGVVGNRSDNDDDD